MASRGQRRWGKRGLRFGSQCILIDVDQTLDILSQALFVPGYARPPAMNPASSAPVSPFPSPLIGEHGANPGNSAEAAQVAPGDIAVGVVIGRASEYFDFFVYGIA